MSSNPLKKFNANEYIFYGEVVGFTKLYEEDKWQSEKSVDDPNKKDRKVKVKINKAYESLLDEKIKALGLLVKVTKSIYTPDFTSDVVEVLPFSLIGDCSLQGTYSTESNISKYFPIGSKIIVVGTKSVFFPNANQQETISVDIGLFNLLSRSYNQTKEFTRYVELDVDYRILVQFPKFELKKDLHRLEFSDSYNETKKILKRLVYYPDKYGTDMDYEMIVRNYLNKWGKEDIENLLKLRNEFVETLKQKR